MIGVFVNTTEDTEDIDRYLGWCATAETVTHTMTINISPIIGQNHHGLCKKMEKLVHAGDQTALALDTDNIHTTG